MKKASKKMPRIAPVGRLRMSVTRGIASGRFYVIGSIGVGPGDYASYGGPYGSTERAAILAHNKLFNRQQRRAK